MRTPFPTCILLALPLLGGCGVEAPGPPPVEPHPFELLGDYNFEGYMYSLQLNHGGLFHAEVWTGITTSGCVKFVGAGSSRGTWRFEDGRVLFSDATEPPSLAVRFEGASAVPTADGFTFSSGGEQYSVVRRLPIPFLSEPDEPIELLGSED